MIEKKPTTELVIRLAVPRDIPEIEHLDSFSTSPARDIHRDIEKYFGSVDPSTHERTLIFLAEVRGVAAGKAELMLPPAGTVPAIGYVKRVVVHPDFRGRGLARQLMQHIIDFAHTEQKLDAIDLHVWEDNLPAIRLYEALGFELQHRELYYRLEL
ncbi:MAG TPA: GNAT family N-acetyltransferase [Ktedonobacteraceae bacterium]|jgi:ribosomal protein S18 acetylase RimI-like enzyme|nr:GNAT family N-acetyltransferase [Ktedonobacteraceae bacterium]